MRLKGIFVTLVIVFALLFAIINWQAITTLLTINFLFLRIQVPLGLVLLTAAVVISILFFLVSLIDRAGQLRQITHLENMNENLQAKLERKRLEEFEQLEKHLDEKLGALQAQVENSTEQTETIIRESLGSFEMRSKERLEKLDKQLGAGGNRQLPQ